MIYVGMIETRYLKMLLKSFHENYSDLFVSCGGINHGIGFWFVVYFSLLFVEIQFFLSPKRVHF